MNSTEECDIFYRHNLFRVRLEDVHMIEAILAKQRVPARFDAMNCGRRGEARHYFHKMI